MIILSGRAPARIQYGRERRSWAGPHFVKVTTKEIGVLKKEIFFTGDVLNTTAPVQSPSNIYDADFLLSKSLVDRLGLTDNYSVQVLGEPHPKGKNRCAGIGDRGLGLRLDLTYSCR